MENKRIQIEDFTTQMNINTIQMAMIEYCNV